MSDPFVTRLAALAPDVDVAASRELFESLRSGDGSSDQQPSNRRWLLAAACVLLLVAGAVGVWAVAGRDDDRVPATPPADETTETTETAQATRGDGTEFRLIAMEAVGDFDRRAVHVADTRDELDSLLGGFRDSFDRYAADVAFQQSAEIAVVIERPDNACPLEIERFVPIEFDSTWRVEWADKPDEPCEDIGLGWVYLVAIPRNALTGIDRIVLPAEPDGSGFELGAIVADPASEPTTTTTTTTPAEADEAALDAATSLVFDGGSGTDGGIAIGASNQAQLDIAMMQFPDVETPPEIDFDTHIAIAFTTMDDGCRAEFRGLNVARTDGGPLQLVPQLVEPASPDGCTEEGDPRLFVVTVQRGVLPDTFEFFVRPNLAPSSGTGVLSTIDLTAPATYSSVHGAPVPPGPITFAASQAPLDALAASVGAAWSTGSVDFGSLVVGTFTIAPGACADDFDGFDVNGRVWTTRFVDPDGCLDADESRWAMVLIERAALEGDVELHHGDATLSVDPAFSIVAARWSCSETDLPLFGATLDLPAAVDVGIEVRDGDEVTGSGTLGNGGDGGTVGFDFGMSGTPSATSVMVVTDLATGREVARMPLGHLPIPTCG